jgi:hypothetical protein
MKAEDSFRIDEGVSAYLVLARGTISCSGVNALHG